MGSFWALFRKLLMILKDIPASLGFVLQNFRGGGVREWPAPRRAGRDPFDPRVSRLVACETIEEPQRFCPISHIPFSKRKINRAVAG